MSHVRKAIEVGMRVVDRANYKRPREAIVLQVSSRYESEPEIAKVRYDAWWKRDRWVSTNDLNPIGEIIPASVPTGGRTEVSKQYKMLVACVVLLSIGVALHHKPKAQPVPPSQQLCTENCLQQSRASAGSVVSLLDPVKAHHLLVVRITTRHPYKQDDPVPIMDGNDTKFVWANSGCSNEWCATSYYGRAKMDGMETVTCIGCQEIEAVEFDVPER